MKRLILTGLMALFFTPIFAPCCPQENRATNIIQQEAEKHAKFRILRAIIAQESGGKWYAYNAEEKASGILQIRPIMIKEANRIAGYEKYKTWHAWDSAVSVQLFWEVQGFHKTGANPIQIALLWNTGHKTGQPNSYVKS